MASIPIGETVGASFRFAFGRYLSLLGILWLPLLVMGVCAYLILVPFFGRLAELMQYMAAHPGAPPVDRLSALNGHIWLFDLIVYPVMAWITVGVTKEALGLRTGPRFVYLSVGWAELRLLGAYILFFVMFFVAALLVGIVIGGIGIALTHGSSAPGQDVVLLPLIMFVIFAGIAMAAIYVFVRFLFLLAPVTVAENRFGLWRSWELSRGHFWSIFAIVLIVYLFLFAVELVLALVFVVPAVVSVFQNAPHDPQAAAAALGLILAKLSQFAPYGAVVGVVLAPVVYGLALAPSAFAYRALTSPLPDDVSRVF